MHSRQVLTRTGVCCRFSEQAIVYLGRERHGCFYCGAAKERQLQTNVTKKFTVTAACNGGAASTGNLKLDDHDPRINHPGDTAALVFEGLSGMLNASEHSHIANRLPWTAELQGGGFKFRGCEATFDVILQGVFHEIATEFRLGSKTAKALIDPSKEKCPGALVVPGTSRIEPLF